MKTFKEIKSDLLIKAKNNNACQSVYKRAEICETEKGALQIIAENFHWAWTTKTITKEDLLVFDSELLKSAGIYIDFEGEIKAELNKIIIISGSPRVVTYDSSSPTVETYGSSSPTVETYSTSSPTVVTHDTSSPRVETYDTSNPTVETQDTSSPIVETYGSSSPRVATYDSSSPTVVTYGSSSPWVKTYDSSSPTVETYDTSSPRISGLTNCIMKNNLSLIIDLDNLTIYKPGKWDVK